MTERGRKTIFFDRDGIINQSPGPGYVECWDDFVLLPDFVDVLSIVTDLGYEAVVITNQRGVARGIVSMETINTIHSNMRQVLRDEHGMEFLDVMVCPHERESCDCRKPLPGMIVEAAERHGLDLSSSWMIGDHETDVEAGIAAGCRTIRVEQGVTHSKADFVFSNMGELKSEIEKILTGAI